MNKQDIIEAAKWVRENCIVIDTETNWNDEKTDQVIEFSAVDPASRAIITDILVETDLNISARATKLHGITHDELNQHGLRKAEFSEIFNHMLKVFGGSKLISSYNLRFDIWALENTFNPKPSGRPCTEWNAQESPLFSQKNDIMELANRYFIEHIEWDTQHSKFKRLSLERCLEITGIQRVGQAHRALSDALAAAELLNFIAEGKSC